jgi:hypothetical protein
MSKLIIAVPAAAIARVLPCISTEETRFYLQGVSIEPAPDGKGAYAVATDGHVMAAEFCPDGRITGEKAIIRFPKDVAKHLRAGRKDVAPRWAVVFGEDIGTARAFIVEGEDAKQAIDIAKAAAAPHLIHAQWLGADIDGSFPDWRRVLPRVDKIAQGMQVDGVNPALLARLTTGAAVVTFWTTGETGDPQAVTRTDAEHWLGVFMPMRGGRELPAWFRPTDTATADKPADKATANAA